LTTLSVYLEYAMKKLSKPSKLALRTETVARLSLSNLELAQARGGARGRDLPSSGTEPACTTHTPANTTACLD
jgi:hypothetical protein